MVELYIVFTGVNVVRTSQLIIEDESASVRFSF